ncbi:unnamed protein product [Ambrosiozyma monospora]|uniref:Unnamed protein product n=1 Tax=Ambrosiozyma monospora TaxID=43982 RepID=A0A9W6YW42_AMBMO|nr:unnamed protein product [Ambrosiozyma monospora]
MDLFHRDRHIVLSQDASTQGDFEKFKQILGAFPMELIIRIIKKAFEVRAIDFTLPDDDHNDPVWNSVLRLAAPKVVYWFEYGLHINHGASLIQEIGNCNICFGCLKISYASLESNDFSDLLLELDTFKRRVAEKISVYWNMDNPVSTNRGNANATRLIDTLHKPCVFEIFVRQDSRSTLTRFWSTSIALDLLPYVTGSQFKFFATDPDIYTFDNCSNLIMLDVRFQKTSDVIYTPSIPSLKELILDYSHGGLPITFEGLPGLKRLEINKAEDLANSIQRFPRGINVPTLSELKMAKCSCELGDLPLRLSCLKILEYGNSDVVPQLSQLTSLLQLDLLTHWLPIDEVFQSLPSLLLSFSLVAILKKVRTGSAYGSINVSIDLNLLPPSLGVFQFDPRLSHPRTQRWYDLEFYFVAERVSNLGQFQLTYNPRQNRAFLDLSDVDFNGVDCLTMEEFGDRIDVNISREVPVDKFKLVESGRRRRTTIHYM